MAEPRVHEPPRIAQRGASVIVVDTGSAWTQNEERATHLAVQWIYGGSPLPGWTPPERSRLDEIPAGTPRLELLIGSDTIGRQLQARVWWGHLDDYGPGEGAWVDWGDHWSSHLPGPVLSNVVTVQDWRSDGPTPLQRVLLELGAAERAAAGSLAVRLGWTRSVRSLEHLRAALDLTRELP